MVSLLLERVGLWRGLVSEMKDSFELYSWGANVHGADQSSVVDDPVR